LLKRVQPTVSGCLAPCGVPNVVAIVTQTKTVRLEIFLGKININRCGTRLRAAKNLSRAVDIAVDIPNELLIHLLEDPVCERIGVAV
jgi:hypothetical protein